MQKNAPWWIYPQPCIDLQENGLSQSKLRSTDYCTDDVSSHTHLDRCDYILHPYTLVAEQEVKSVYPREDTSR